MIEIKLKEFSGDEAGAESLYTNDSYDDSFVFKTKFGSVHTGNIGWEQGWGNNYRFYVGEDRSDHFYFPSDVTHVEVK